MCHSGYKYTCIECNSVPIFKFSTTSSIKSIDNDHGNELEYEFDLICNKGKHIFPYNTSELYCGN